MRRLRFVSMVVGVALAAAAPRAEAASDAGELVRMESAFAADAASLGTRGAFLKYLSPTGIVFRPGPVNGIASFEERPANASRLSWHAIHAELSAADDIGWTTGPSEFRGDSTQREPDGYGHYVSVWRRQADGTWRVAIDGGIGHGPSPDWGAPPTSRTLGAPAGGGRPLADRRGLWKADADFARLAASGGLASAIARSAAEDVRVYRNGSQPFVGRSIAKDSLAAREGAAALVSNAQFVGKGGDLGYTYGTFVVTGVGVPDTSSYVHIWRRAPAKSWELAVQLLMPWK